MNKTNVEPDNSLAVEIKETEEMFSKTNLVQLYIYSIPTYIYDMSYEICMCLYTYMFIC